MFSCPGHSECLCHAGDPERTSQRFTQGKSPLKVSTTNNAGNTPKRVYKYVVQGGDYFYEIPSIQTWGFGPFKRPSTLLMCSVRLKQIDIGEVLSDFKAFTAGFPPDMKVQTTKALFVYLTGSYVALRPRLQCRKYPPPSPALLPDVVVSAVRCRFAWFDGARGWLIWIL